MQLMKLSISLLIVFVADLVIHAVSTTLAPSGIDVLTQAAIMLPSWVYALMRTALHIILGLAFYLMWTSSSASSRKSAQAYFGVYLVAIAIWVGLVQMQLFVVAAAIAMLTITFILLASASFWSFSRLAAALLFPSTLWSIYNLAITISLLSKNI